MENKKSQDHFQHQRCRYQASFRSRRQVSGDLGLSPATYRGTQAKVNTGQAGTVFGVDGRLHIYLHHTAFAGAPTAGGTHSLEEVLAHEFIHEALKEWPSHIPFTHDLAGWDGYKPIITLVNSAKTKGDLGVLALTSKEIVQKKVMRFGFAVVGVAAIIHGFQFVSEFRITKQAYPFEADLFPVRLQMFLLLAFLMTAAGLAFIRYRAAVLSQR